MDVSCSCFEYFVGSDQGYRKDFAPFFSEDERSRFEFADVTVAASGSFRKNQIRAVFHLFLSAFKTFYGAPPVFAVDRNKVVKPHRLSENRDLEKLLFGKDTHIQRNICADQRNVGNALVVCYDEVGFIRRDVFKPLGYAADSARFEQNG